MRIPLVKKCIITMFNIIFPPFAVGALTGFTSRDTLVNSCLFLLAVFPAHIHGAIISWTYFSRKRKVRKGRFAGEERSYVFSEKVQTGGAGWDEYERLRDEKRNSKSKRAKQNSSRPSSYTSDIHGKDTDLAHRSNRSPGHTLYESDVPNGMPSRHSTQRRSRHSRTYY